MFISADFWKTKLTKATISFPLNEAVHCSYYKNLLIITPVTLSVSNDGTEHAIAISFPSAGVLYSKMKSPMTVIM